MNCLRLSGSARPETCSAGTLGPRMTKMATPASPTAFAERAGGRGGVARVARRREAGRGGHARPRDLLDPAADEVLGDGFGVHGLEPPGGRLLVQLGPLGKHGFGVVEIGRAS